MAVCMSEFGAESNAPGVYLSWSAVQTI